MAPKLPVRVVTKGPSDPAVIVTKGPAIPCIVVSEGDGPSHPIRIDGGLTVGQAYRLKFGKFGQAGGSGCVAPVVDFTGDVIVGDAPLTVNFTSTVTGTSPFIYAWDFGDTGTSNDANPSHTYTNPGIYTVSLTVTNACGNDTRTRANYITANFVGFLDSVSNVEHVYLLLRGLGSYSGSLIRVRRDSDDAELDFGVDIGGEFLDVAAITAWLAGSTGYVVTIYDQAASGDDITQGTAANQPALTLSDANFNNRPTMTFANDSIAGVYTTGGALSQPFTVYSVAKLNAGSVNDNVVNVITDDDDTLNTMLIGTASSTSPDNWRIYAGTNLLGGAADSNANIWTALFNAASSQFWHNGTSKASGNTGAAVPNGLRIGSNASGAVGFWAGQIIGAIIIDGNSSNADKNIVNTKLGTVYGIPVVDI